MKMVTVVFRTEAWTSLRRFAIHQGPRVHRIEGLVGALQAARLTLASVNVCSILTQGHVSWVGWSTTDTDGALCTGRTQGLRRLQRGLLSLSTRGLVHLWGLAADWDTLCRWGWVDILRYSA
jgi:hypothetical protein